MNSIRAYRVPVMIGAAGLVVALLIWTILVAPQNTKLSGLEAKQTQLANQQTALESKLAALRTEKQKLSSSCADLQTIATEIPSVENPTDLDAEESSFQHQFNQLAASSGVALSQYSGFAPTSAATAAAPATASGTSGASAGSNVTAVPTTLSVTGTYGQMMSFVNKLDSFPRLFVIQNFVLSFGTSASVPTGGGSAASASGSSPPLWVGGTPTSPTSSPYSLAITGSIYYTSAPNALDACTKATAAK